MARGRAGTIARVYAETLLRMAERESALEEVSAGFDEVVRSYRESERFRRFLEAPQIGAEEKRRLVSQAFETRVHPLVVRFLELLIERHREPLVGEIHAAWETLLDRRANRRAASVTTAVPADPDMLAAIRRALERATGQEIVLEERVDPGLLGGLVVRTGDLVMDASLRSRLSTLRHRLHAAATGRARGAA